jgi:tetratricopeptide (TPR) repeat protein
MDHARTRQLLIAVSWLALFALGAALALQSVRTFDYWWHLRSGQLIAETGSVPTADPFSFTASGNPWIDIHWLHQLALYGLYVLGGHDAVVLAKVVMVLLLVAILATIGYRRERPLVSIFGLTLTLLVVSDRIMPRPELLTFVFLAAVFALLERFTRKNDAWVYAIVGVQLLWANVHGLFAVGVAVCGAYLVAEVLRPFVLPGSRVRAAWIRRLATVTAISALAALANPNLLDGALYPIQQLGMIGPPEDRGYFGSMIAELIPPIGSQTRLPPLALALFATLAALSFAAMALNWRRIQGAHPLLWVAFLYLALGAQRNLALFAIVAGPIFAVNLNEFLDGRRASGRRLPLGGGLELTAAGLVSLVLFGVAADAARGGFYPRIGSTREPGFGVMEVFFPIGAADWIASHRPQGPICHHMADGGYLIWRLYPDYPVMADGRLEVYGAETFSQLQMSQPESFRKLADRLHCGVVLVHYSLVEFDSLLWWLYLNSNWKLTFLDDVAAVFVRVPADGPSLYREVDVDADDLFAPLDDAPTATNQIRRFARTGLYTALRRYDKALALWQETLAIFPDLDQGPTVHAALLHHNGFVAASEAIFRSLLEQRPDDPGLHTQLGDLRLESGDREEARKEYDAALAIDPHHPYAMYRRATVAEADGDPEGAAVLYLRVMAASHPASSLAVGSRLRLEAIAR